MFHSRYSIYRVVLLTILFGLAVSSAGFHAVPALAQESSNVVIVNTGALHIRSGPAANTSVLGTVPGGAELPVTGRNPGSTWWRVQSPFGTGWVSDYYVVFRGNIDAVPIVSIPEGTLETPVAFVQGLPVTVYGNPNTASFVMGIVPGGVSLPVLGRSPDGAWWQVSTAMGSGWVHITEVALRGDASIIPTVGDPGPSFRGPTVRVNVDVTVTQHPGGGDTVTTLPAGTTLPVRGRSADNTWWQVSGDFGYGWFPVAHVSIAGSASNIPVVADAYTRGPGYTGASAMNAIVESDRKVAYGENTYDSDPIWDARRGEHLGVLARSPNGLWLQVIKSNGWRGWMNFSGLTLQGSMADLPIYDLTPVVENVVIVNTGRLNIRSGPGVEYAVLTSVPGGTTLSVSGRHPTLPWIRVTGDYGTGWVRIMFIIFRGNWSAVPLVTEPVGALEVPQVIIATPHNVYSEPAWDMPAGVVQPGMYPLVGWSPGYQWAQIETELGRVWIQRAEFNIRGIAENAPIVG